MDAPVQGQEVVVSIPQAPTERGIQVIREADVVFSLAIQTDTEVSINHTFSQLLKSQMTGMSRAWLVKAELHYAFTKSGQSLQGVITHTSNEATLNQLWGAPGAFYERCTAYTALAHRTITLQVPGLYSRQLQPHSADLPEARFLCSISAGMNASLNLSVSYAGSRHVYSTIDLK